MKICFLVNTLESSRPGATTYGFALEASRRGHEVWLTSPGNLLYELDNRIGALAKRVPAGRCRSVTALNRAIHETRSTEINLEEFDVFFMRNNPAAQKEWAQHAGIHFGRMLVHRGVIVLPDPTGLSQAANKLYLNSYPPEIRPRTLVTRSTDRIVSMLDEEGTIVVKPLTGYGGKGVFLLRREDPRNVEQIIESLCRDGFIVAQEYLPSAAAGDTRLFLMNGIPLRYRGKIAAIRRIHTGDDVRSNIHAGGRIRRAHIDDDMLTLADMVRPRLVEDGMFLVGLDIAGDKLMEINVFSPGGFGSAKKLEKVNFTRPVIDSIERKVDYVTHYRRQFDNVDLCTL